MDFEVVPAVLAGVIAGTIMEGPVYMEKTMGLPVKQNIFRTNWATHFGLGTMWGSAYGVAAHAGLSGQKAVAAVFGAVYTGDVALNTVA